MRTTYITDSAGLRHGLIEAIDALLPALPGNPEAYVDERGRLDLAMVRKGDFPHSHSTAAAADLIQELWNGRHAGGLYQLIGHAGQNKRHLLARALTLLALDLDPETVVGEARLYEEHIR